MIKNCESHAMSQSKNSFKLTTIFANLFSVMIIIEVRISVAKIAKF